MKLIRSLFVLMMLLVGTNVFAADPEPVAMLKKMSNQMLVELDKNIGNLKNNDKLVDGLVTRILVPRFDLNSMSRSVVGRYWQQESSGAVQQQFTKEFTRYVVKTYSSAMQSYDGEKMKFYPIRGSIGNKVQVNSDLLLKSAPPIQIRYSLMKKNGQWLIYDFSVDGISIVKNYNAQFASMLRQGGLAGLVKKLQKRNAGN